MPWSADILRPAFPWCRSMSVRLFVRFGHDKVFRTVPRIGAKAPDGPCADPCRGLPAPTTREVSAELRAPAPVEPRQAPYRRRGRPAVEPMWAVGGSAPTMSAGRPGRRQPHEQRHSAWTRPGCRAGAVRRRPPAPHPLPWSPGALDAGLRTDLAAYDAAARALLPGSCNSTCRITCPSVTSSKQKQTASSSQNQRTQRVTGSPCRRARRASASRRCRRRGCAA